MTAASFANHFEGLLFGLVLSLVCVVALLEAGLWLRPLRSGGRAAEGSPTGGADAASSGGELGWWQGLDEGEPPARPSWPEARNEGDFAGATVGGWRPAPADDLEALAGLGGAAGGLFVLFPRKANRVSETLTAAPEPQGLRLTSRPKGGLPRKALSGDWGAAYEQRSRERGPLRMRVAPPAPYRTAPAKALALAALAFGVGACSPSGASKGGRALHFEPCTLASGGSALAARCGTLEVPEDRSKPGGRKVRLAVAIVPSQAERGEPDPVFFLAGGPGQSARDSFVAVAPAFHEVLERRDVVLVDQRGTGASNPIVCSDTEGPKPPGEQPDESPEMMRALAARCLSGLDADPRFYTTGDAVDDLEAVREALAAPSVDLVGVSYGTRVAQEYARRHPTRVRTMVLDGVVPPGLVLGAEFARSLDDALAAASARCEADLACQKRYGAPRAALSRLIERARGGAETVRFRDPITNAPREAKLDESRVVAVARLFSYHPKLVALLPLAIDEALAGRPEALVAQASMVEGLLGEEIAYGMQLSVICAEDADLLTPDPADEARVLGGAFVRATKAQCEVWPRGRRAPDFHAPLASEAPTLLLSGEFDPVTPPRYGDRVLETLPRGRHLVARGQGHNVLVVGCMPKLLARFLREGDAKAIDASCLDRLGPTPPFEGHHGWGP